MAAYKISDGLVGRQEIWKSVPEHLGYSVSSVGRMRTHWKMCGHRKSVLVTEGRLIELRYNGPWYVQVNMRGHNTLVHILVLSAFVGPRPVVPGCKVEARHLNDVKWDNRLENLAWGVQAENIEDAKRNGKILFGEDQPNSLMTEEVASEILRLYATGRHYHKDLALRFGVSRGMVRDLCSGATWKHLSRPVDMRRRTAVQCKEEIVAAFNDGCSRKQLSQMFGFSLMTMYRVCPVVKEGVR